MGRISFDSIIDEMVVFLRNNITDPESRPNTKTEYFSGDGSTVAFTLANTANCKNVKTVHVGTTAKTFGTDYTVAYATATVITFTTAPASGTNNIKITYADGETWVYADYPRVDLTQKSYPRIAVDHTDVSTVPHGLNAQGDMSSILISVIIYAQKAHTVRTIIDEVRDDIADNKKSFYYFTYIYPVAVSAIIPSPNRAEQILQSTVDFRIPFAQETNT